MLLLMNFYIEIFVLSLPPLLLGLSQKSTLLSSIRVEEISFLSPQIIENSLIRGNFQILVLFILGQLIEVVIDKTSWNSGTFNFSFFLYSSQIMLERCYSVLQRVNQFRFPFNIFFDHVLIWSFLGRELVKFALILGMEYVVFLRERVFS